MRPRQAPGSTGGAVVSRDRDKAQQTLPVRRAHAGRPARVELLGERPQRLDAALVEHVSGERFRLGARLGNLRQSVGERTEVEPRSADDHSRPATLGDPPQRLERLVAPPADRVALLRVHVSEQVMGRARQFVGPRPRGEHAEVAIHLHGVRVDDLGAQRLSGRERESGLAARRRTGEKQNVSVHRRYCSMSDIPGSDVAGSVTARSPGADPQRWTLTLVAGRGETLAGAGDDARKTLGETGAKIIGSRFLSPTAEETELHGEYAPIRERLEAAFAPRALDWCLQSAPARPRRLLLCDMDSTIISCECIDEIAAIVGIKAEIAEITERAMRGELDFEAALEARVARLAGVRAADLETVYAERIRLNSGASTLTATMKAHGARAVLVSGGFTFFTNRVAAAAGFDAHHGNTLELRDGALTGRVTPPILGRTAKREALERHAAEIGRPRDDAVAIGDGANDLDMIRAAGVGIAYRAKPVVEAQAQARIATGDLRSALYFQSIAAADFIERG